MESKAVEILRIGDTITTKSRHWFDDYKEGEVLPGSIVSSYQELNATPEDVNDD